VVEGYAQMLEIPVSKGFSDRVADSQVKPKEENRNLAKTPQMK
jgi:hypothetical protein